MPRPSHDLDVRSSFHDIFHAELAYVIRSLRRLGVADADVEDVAQEVFVAVHGRLPTADLAKPLHPWLFAFCCRLAANHRRLARHGAELGDPYLERRADPAADPHARAEQSERRALLLEALEAVPFERRTVLVMHDLDGCSAPVVSETLEIPLNTVYSRLRIARNELEAAVRSLRERHA